MCEADGGVTLRDLESLDLPMGLMAEVEAKDYEYKTTIDVKMRKCGDATRNCAEETGVWRVERRFGNL